MRAPAVSSDVPSCDGDGGKPSRAAIVGAMSTMLATRATRVDPAMAPGAAMTIGTRTFSSYTNNV